MPKPTQPSRGEVWNADLEPVVGHEQGESRPVLIVSTDHFNHSKSGLVVTVPVSRTKRQQPMHVPVTPPEGGLTAGSFIFCDQVRTISVDRLKDYRGVVTDTTLQQVSARLRLLIP